MEKHGQDRGAILVQQHRVVVVVVAASMQNEQLINACMQAALVTIAVCLQCACSVRHTYRTTSKCVTKRLKKACKLCSLRAVRSQARPADGDVSHTTGVDTDGITQETRQDQPTRPQTATHGHRQPHTTRAHLLCTSSRVCRDVAQYVKVDHFAGI